MTEQPVDIFDASGEVFIIYWQQCTECLRPVGSFEPRETTHDRCVDHA